MTGIGGNVGQGILRCIRDEYPQICLVGTNSEYLSAGNHFCDRNYQVPLAEDEAYLEVLREIVEKEAASLVIPATDSEVEVLSRLKDSLPATVAVSGAESALICIDKYLTSCHFEEKGILFARTALPSVYDGSFGPIIAKPRRGRGSRGLVLNPEDYSQFEDSEYVIQELAEGPELTTSFYVTKKGQLHGLITQERKLSNGATVFSKVRRDLDSLVLPTIVKMLEHLELRGSINLQWIYHSESRVVPFEVNCRISGTNSLRHRFGFKDVVYTVQEYLFDQNPEAAAVVEGVGMRFLEDIVMIGQTEYPDGVLAEVGSSLY